jgi:hypothetical protein
MIPKDKQVTVICNRYHIKNGVTNTDGSLGSVYITPKQLEDLVRECLGYKELNDDT